MVTIDDLEKMIANESLYNLFLEFSQAEWSSENLLYYRAVIKFQKEPTIQEANRIYDNFLKLNSPCEINISRQICNEIKENIDQEKIRPLLFEKSLNTVRTNLNDTYSRFLSSGKYKSWKTEFDIKDHMMDEFK